MGRKAVEHMFCPMICVRTLAMCDQLGYFVDMWYGQGLMGNG